MMKTTSGLMFEGVELGMAKNDDGAVIIRGDTALNSDRA